MESNKLVVESDTSKSSFLAHVFNFDDDTKSQFLNIIQYTVLAVLPVVLLNKTVSRIIPEVDEDKSTYLMIIELLGQSILMLFGMFMIHRLITYFPTYSKMSYAPFHTTNIIILFLVIAASFQTRIGEKSNIMIDRFFDLVEGRTTLSGDNTHKQNDHNKGTPQNGTSAMHPMPPPPPPQHQPSRADVGSTHLSQLQTNERAPDFNTMFSGPNNPLQNAQTPSVQESFTEPVAANEMGGTPWNAF